MAIPRLDTFTQTQRVIAIKFFMNLSGWGHAYSIPFPATGARHQRETLAIPRSGAGMLQSQRLNI